MLFFMKLMFIKNLFVTMSHNILSTISYRDSTLPIILVHSNQLFILDTLSVIESGIQVNTCLLHGLLSLV